MQNFSQRDARWKDIILGDGSVGQTIGLYGCAVVCIADIVGETPDIVNKKLKDGKCFSGDLIYFDRVPNVYLQLKFIGKQNYDNTVALDYINRNGFCIVEVDFDGSVATGGDTHFVVYEGNHLCRDPWDGTEKPTSAYPLTKLLVLYDKVEVPQPSQNAPQEVTIDLTGLVTELTKTGADTYGVLNQQQIEAKFVAKDLSLMQCADKILKDEELIIELQNKLNEQVPTYLKSLSPWERLLLVLGLSNYGKKA